MDIAALSMNMSQAEVVQKASIAVMAMGMDNMEQFGDQLTKMMEQSVHPNVGKNIDISV